MTLCLYDVVQSHKCCSTYQLISTPLLDIVAGIKLPGSSTSLPSHLDIGAGVKLPGSPTSLPPTLIFFLT